QQKRTVREILDLHLGWDITDFGAGDFSKTGLLLFTLRNGKVRSRFYLKPYAEKIMIVGEGQVTPMHFHWKKMEDIINRGGGNLMIELYRATAHEGLSTQPVTVSIDGSKKVLSAGSTLRLTPGQSITLPQRLYHRFYGEPANGNVIVGEVSMVNDDNKDNRFFEQIGRFPAINEDTLPTYLLCTDYSTFIR
ncbi:MAG TPA: D-lyxose/D-mannose family sugar isomerase, partial [Bacteroidota bacterium]|nr:D-lyxose/D-mannose family sugar isomerase [Bacteroidota bacterium]